MSVALRNRWVAMAQDLLHVVQRPPGVNQKTGVLVAQVVDTQERHPSLDGHTAEHAHDRGVGLARANLLAGLLGNAMVHEQVVIRALGFQLAQHIKCTVVQRDHADAARLRGRRRDTPDPSFTIDVAPLCRQCLIQAGASAEQEQCNLADRARAFRGAQYSQQALQLLLGFGRSFRTPCAVSRVPAGAVALVSTIVDR